MVNYPDLQEMFIRYYFDRKESEFFSLIAPILAKEKASRKTRFWRFSKYPFFTKESLIKDLESIRRATALLFDLKYNDPLFVEKSYYMLQQMISFAKREGIEELKDFVENNSTITSEPRWDNSTYTRMLNTHLDPDLSWTRFETNLEHHKNYCRDYRSSSYALRDHLRWKVVLWKELD